MRSQIIPMNKKGHLSVARPLQLPGRALHIIDFIMALRCVNFEHYSPDLELTFGAAGVAGAAEKNPSASLVRPDCRVISRRLA